MILAGFGTMLLDGIRVLFSVIDSVVYWLLVKTYNLLTEIAQVNIFDSGSGGFGTRVYTIMGVIMLFKLAFSIINYIIDPDKLADSKAGMSNMIKNIFVMLVLVVTVPIIFKYATALQYLILEDNTIGRLVTGKEGGTKDNLGEDMAVSILSGFVRINEDLSGVPPKCIDSLNPDVETLKKECVPFLANYDQELADNYATAFGNIHGGYNYLLKAARSNAKVGDEYVISYTFGISTIVGGLCAYIFLLFCIDVAVRSVKLAFLQLIAPLPIASYIDVKGQQGMFKKWVDACISTYLDLFVRLAAIDFAIYIISEFIMNSELQICHWQFSGDSISQTTCDKTGIFTTIFLILGTLMFAKSLPKLMSDITGFKMDGNLEMNAMKKLAAVPLVGGAAAEGIALAGRTGSNILRGTGAAVANKTGLANKGKAVAEKINSLKTRAGAKMEGIDRVTGGAVGRIGRDFGNYGTKMKYGIGNALGHYDRVLDRKEAEEAQIIARQQKKQAAINGAKQVIDSVKDVYEHADKKVKESQLYKSREMEVSALQKAYEQAVANGPKAGEGKDEFDARTEDLRKKATEANNNLVKDAKKWRYQYVNSDGLFDGATEKDAELVGKKSVAEIRASKIKIDDEDFKIDVKFNNTNAKDIKESMDTILGNIATETANMSGGSQRISELQEEQKSLRKGIAAGKEFLDHSGGKK